MPLDRRPATAGSAVTTAFGAPGRAMMER